MPTLQTPTHKVEVLACTALYQQAHPLEKIRDFPPHKFGGRDAGIHERFHTDMYTNRFVLPTTPLPRIVEGRNHVEEMDGVNSKV